MSKEASAPVDVRATAPVNVTIIEGTGNGGKQGFSSVISAEQSPAKPFTRAPLERIKKVRSPR